MSKNTLRWIFNEVWRVARWVWAWAYQRSRELRRNGVWWIFIWTILASQPFKSEDKTVAVMYQEKLTFSENSRAIWCCYFQWLLGTLSKKAQGIQHYKIKHYRDLNPLLGKNWHFRGLNVNADYGYVILETLEFFLRKSRPLEEYLPTPSQEEDSGSPSTCMSLVDTGYYLTFMFVCGYGTRSTFGKDQKIFY